jgi:hypothetical protein
VTGKVAGFLLKSISLRSIVLILKYDVKDIYRENTVVDIPDIVYNDGVGKFF